MSSLIYTQQKSKLSKKQRAAQEALLKEQRAIKEELRKKSMREPLVQVGPVDVRGSTRHIPSLVTAGGSAAKRESPVYTGDQMIGIGQLQKSSAVPVFKQEDAQDLANMRR